jgi:hypothetical protein
MCVFERRKLCGKYNFGNGDNDNDDDDDIVSGVVVRVYVWHHQKHVGLP